MARRILFLGVLLLAGCPAGPASPPAAELTLYDGPVRCDVKTNLCTSGGAVVGGEYHRLRVDAARGRGGAVRLRARLPRASGALATLELDARPGSPATPPRVSYVEQQGGVVVFQAARAAGRVELGVDRGCACQTARLDLLLLDAGPDGKLGTADDRQRRLTRARLRLDDRPFCHGQAVLEIREDLLVVGARACPVRRGAPPAGGYPSCGWTWSGEVIVFVEDWNEGGWYDEGWVGEWTEELPPEPDWSSTFTDPYDPPPEAEGWGDPAGDPAGGGSGGGDGWTGDPWGGDSWSEDAWTEDPWTEDPWAGGGSDDGSDWGDGGDDWGDGDDWW